MSGLIAGVVTIVTTVLSLRGTERRHLSEDERDVRRTLKDLLDACESRCAQLQHEVDRLQREIGEAREPPA